MGFVVLSALSPLVLLTLGIWGLSRAGEFRVLPSILLATGAILAVVAALDVPVKIRLDEAGVHRRCLLRRQVLAWDDVLGLRRPRTRRGRRTAERPVRSSPGVAEGSDPGRGGLLVETTARRQYMLSAGRERPATYAAIEAVVRRHAPGLSLPGPPYYPRADSAL